MDDTKNLMVNTENFMKLLISAGCSPEFAVQEGYKVMLMQQEDFRKSRFLFESALTLLECSRNIGIDLDSQRKKG